LNRNAAQDLISVLAGVVLVVSGCQRTQGLSAALCETRSIAKEAYIYGFPLVDNCRFQQTYFVDIGNPEYKGSWNAVHNTARVYTPEDKAIQTPNSDTP
jgi:hypothetical protein